MHTKQFKHAGSKQNSVNKGHMAGVEHKIPAMAAYGAQQMVVVFGRRAGNQTEDVHHRIMDNARSNL